MWISTCLQLASRSLISSIYKLYTRFVSIRKRTSNFLVDPVGYNNRTGPLARNVYPIYGVDMNKTDELTDAEILDRANVLPVDLVETALGMCRVVGGTRMPCGPTRDEISSAREKIAALIGRRGAP